MNKTQKLLMIITVMVAAILLLSASPIRTAIAAEAAAGAEIVDVSLRNKNPGTITVTFLGLNVYHMDLKPGGTTVKMVRGTYQTSYYGCGKLQIANVTLKAKGSEIIFEDCNKSQPASTTGSSGTTSKAEETVQFTIHNKNHLKIEVTLLGGPENYVFDAPPEIRTRFRVKPGPYQYSYYACGKLHIGNITINNKGTELKVIDCFENQNTEENAPATHRALVIRNRQYLKMEVSLTGVVESYQLDVPNGNHTFFVHKGPYTYAFFACGEVYIGVINVPDKGTELIITECGAGGNGQALSRELLSFHVKNNTRQTMVLQLKGPQTYLYTVAGSGTDLVVTKGFYEYTIWACGTSYSGVINVHTTGLLLKSPYCQGTGPTNQ